jgi:hypothetical protein
MSGIFRRHCRRHQEALLAFVDRRDVGPTTDAALAHLDRCDRCGAELEDVALAIHALRTIGREAALLEPPAGDWPALAARVRRPGDPAWRWRMPLAGLVATAAVVALLVGPGSVWRTRPVILQEAGTDPVLLADRRAESIRLERRYQRYRVPITVVEQPAQPPSSFPPIYPDGWIPEHGTSQPADTAPAVMVRAE